MSDPMAACNWGRARPRRSRISRFALARAFGAGEAFGNAKGEPEDDDMRWPRASSRCARIVGLLIYPATAL
jgi:hypothetical protein